MVTRKVLWGSFVPLFLTRDRALLVARTEFVSHSTTTVTPFLLGFSVRRRLNFSCGVAPLATWTPSSSPCRAWVPRSVCAKPGPASSCEPWARARAIPPPGVPAGGTPACPLAAPAGTGPGDAPEAVSGTLQSPPCPPERACVASRRRSSRPPVRPAPAASPRSGPRPAPRARPRRCGCHASLRRGAGRRCCRRLQRTRRLGTPSGGCPLATAAPGCAGGPPWGGASWAAPEPAPAQGEWPRAGACARHRCVAGGRQRAPSALSRLPPRSSAAGGPGGRCGKAL
uniref:Uncharacterized protein n=1 Tax=Ixodes ricinus TaxID=34613 RepID=A0A6B0V7A4_IXORI